VAGAGFWAAGGPSLFGQKLEDRNTEFYKSYDGAWDLACDRASGERQARCYGQLVDVYSPDPNFRAAILHLTYEKENTGKRVPQLLFNLEADLDFSEVKAVVRTKDGASKALSLGNCSGNRCKIKGEAAEAILADWREGDALELDLPEREGRKVISWPLSSFSQLLDELTKQRTSRNLL
jgi:invasion protein IalB